jgi:hypothetical protein
LMIAYADLLPGIEVIRPESFPLPSPAVFS